MVEGGVDDAIGSVGAAPQAVGVRHFAPVDLCTRGQQGLGCLFGTGEAEHLVARAE